MAPPDADPGTFRRTPPLVAATVIAVSLMIVAAAQRDIARRSAGEIRGPKLLWRILCTNVSGVVPYTLWARRVSADA